jgi:hypothetical protein
MIMVQEMIESGLAIQIAIGLIMVEAIIIFAVRRSRAGNIILGLIPGLCLMLALLGAVQGLDWRVIAFWITASLPFHLADVRRRLRD